MKLALCTGMVQSPNFTAESYPHDLDKTQTILVQKANLLRLEFTHFDVEWHSKCRWDYVQISDEDGTLLMNKSCGSSLINPDHRWNFQPMILTTSSNRVNIFFHTDHSVNKSGWSLNWTSLLPGVKYLRDTFSVMDSNKNLLSFFLSCFLIDFLYL